MNLLFPFLVIVFALTWFIQANGAWAAWTVGIGLLALFGLAMWQFEKEMKAVAKKDAEDRRRRQKDQNPFRLIRHKRKDGK